MTDEPKFPETKPIIPKCRSCGQTGGPYPKGNRPKSNARIISGCPRCGYCV